VPPLLTIKVRDSGDVPAEPETSGVVNVKEALLINSVPALGKRGDLRVPLPAGRDRVEVGAISADTDLPSAACFDVRIVRQ
jgi:hypothetical protein